MPSDPHAALLGLFHVPGPGLHLQGSRPVLTHITAPPPLSSGKHSGQWDTPHRKSTAISMSTSIPEASTPLQTTQPFPYRSQISTLLSTASQKQLQGNQDLLSAN